MGIRAALIGGLLHVSAVLVATGLSVGPVGFPQVHQGGPVGAAVGAWFGVLLLVAAAVGAVIAAITAGLGARASPPDRAWPRAAWTAAVTVNLLQVANLIEGPSPRVLISLGVPTIALVALTRWKPRRPLLAAAALPTLCLAGALLYGSVTSIFKWRGDRERALVWKLEDDLKAGDSDALGKDLARAGDIDLTEVAHAAMQLGDRLRQLEILVRHARRGCLAGVAPLFEKDLPLANLESEPCAQVGLYVAARKSRPLALAALLQPMPRAEAIVYELRLLVTPPDSPAAIDFLRAAGWLDSRGKIDPARYDEDFVNNAWHSASTPEQRAFYFDHADLDALLVADPGEELIRRGANVNARTASGWTPLTSYLSTKDLGYGSPVFRELLRAGADPNLKGGVPPEPPLWYVLSRSRDTFVTDEYITLLLAKGADPAVVREFPNLDSRLAKLFQRKK